MKWIVELNEKFKAVKQLDNSRKTSTGMTARQYLSSQTHKSVKNDKLDFSEVFIIICFGKVNVDIVKTEATAKKKAFVRLNKNPIEKYP